jgi:hypothetical protein
MCSSVYSSKGASTSGTASPERAGTEGDVTSLSLLEQALLIHPIMLQKLIEKTPIKEVSHCIFQLLGGRNLLGISASQLFCQERLLIESSMCVTQVG